MNAVVPLTRPRALPRQQYDELRLLLATGVELFQNASLRALCSGQEGE